MRILYVFAVGCLTALALVACSALRPPADKDLLMRVAVADLRDGRFEQLETRLSPKIKGPNDAALFTRMRSVLPASSPQDIKAIRWGWTGGRDGQHFSALYLYRYPERSLIVNETVELSAGNTPLLTEFRLNPVSNAELQRQASFTLLGKSPVHYFVLGLFILVPLIILAALIDLVRARNIKRKWLWALGIVWGFGALQINWLTGDWRLGLLNIFLFGSAIFRSPIGPWVLTTSLPVFAIIFLMRDRRPSRVSRKQMLDLGGPSEDVSPPS